MNTQLRRLCNRDPRDNTAAEGKIRRRAGEQHNAVLIIFFLGT